MAFIGPHSAEDDLICHLRRAPVPFVLREKEDYLYTLVGSCYVHGEGDTGRGDYDWTSFFLE